MSRFAAPPTARRSAAGASARAAMRRASHRFAAGGVSPRAARCARSARHLLVTWLSIGLFGAAVHAAPAAADEQPAILKAYGLDWIERVRDDAWPQPKTERPVICLLDTGVAITPDTPADDPNGPIVARLAIDGGTGVPQGTTFEHMHGTTMASVIAAPRNDWGTVGVFPQARIVSIRVTMNDAIFITPANMELGVRACRNWAVEAKVNVGAVVMAESRYDQRPIDVDKWTTAANLAGASNAVFVAAAGNDAAAQALPPATASGVLTVSAGDDVGALCGFANAEPTNGIRGPGCSSSSSAWPTGSSAATATVGAVAAAVSTFSPTTNPSSLADQLRASIGSSGAFNGLSLSAQFAGFVNPPAEQPIAVPNISGDGAPGALVVSPLRAAPSVGGQPTRQSHLVLWRPRVSAAQRGTRLVVRRLDRRGGFLWVQVPKGTRAPKSFSGRTMTLRVPKKTRHLVVWAASGDSTTWRSLTTSVRVKA